MDMRDMRMMGDGRRLPPRNSRGEFRRRRRGDRGMYDMRGDYATVPPINPQYPNVSTSGATRDYRGDYGYDGHYGHRQGGYQPVEFMGYCSGYYGSPDQDYGRGDYGDMRYDMRRDYGDMRGRRDYGYDMRMDYGYRDYGDYGEESLSKEELKEWEHKLMGELDDRERQMFKKEVIIPKFKQMGIEMKDFTEDELYVFTLAKYLDHKHSIGQNPDLAIKIAKDNLCDQDIAYQGSVYLAKYFDTFVEPRD